MVEAIRFFRGKFSFLSNHYERPIKFEGLVYKNSESAFQAMKCKNIKDREKFTNLSGKEAKVLGRKIKLREDWEEIKENYMFRVNVAKFTQHEDLRELLLSTGNALLEEGNFWGDKYWGTVCGEGENRLGKILMRIRKELRSMS